MYSKKLNKIISYFLLSICMTTFWSLPTAYADECCYYEEQPCCEKRSWLKDNGLALGGALVLGAVAGAIAGNACKKSCHHHKSGCGNHNGEGGNPFGLSTTTISATSANLTVKFSEFDVTLSEPETILIQPFFSVFDILELGDSIQTAGGTIIPPALDFFARDLFGIPFHTGLRITIPAHSPPTIVTLSSISTTVTNENLGVSPVINILLQLTPGVTFEGSTTQDTTFILSGYGFE